MRGAAVWPAGVAVALLGACAHAPQVETPASPREPASTTAPLPARADAQDEGSTEEVSAYPPAALSQTPRTIGAAPVRRLAGGRGRPIDLDVKGADLADVCRLIADVGHVNIVVADGVAGTVTVKIKGVPWDQALEAIVRAKGLRTEREGNVILVER